MKTDAFDYDLPEELIASHPPERRDGGRLLVLEPDTGNAVHAAISEIADHLPPRCLLVANDTRVIRARLRAERPTGGRVELLLVRGLAKFDGACRWLALAHANKPLKVGDPVVLGDGIGARVAAKGERGEIEIDVDAPEERLLAHAAAHGEVPLPPYIRRAPEKADEERYQTVFARHDGSVAAPTAGLHFTPESLAALQERGHELLYVTLHVGPGTFRPIVADDLSAHRMDAERFFVPAETAQAIRRAKAEGRPVIAIGTTSVRALEGSAAVERAAADGAPASEGMTEIFISPGYEFRVVDGLVTNFHLPRSTLLCLVAALAGREHVLAAYREAVARRYRFYSYGDAMLVLPRPR